MKPCDGLEKHLSALVDGELNALEAIAIRTHIAECPHCSLKVRHLESLKMQLHRAGQEIKLPAQTKMAWRHMLVRQDAPLVPHWLLGIGGSLATLMAVVILFQGSSTPTAIAWPEIPSEQAASQDIARKAPLNGKYLRTLVRAHLRGFGSLPRQTEGLLAIERVPAHLLERGRAPRLIRASYSACEDSTRSATLAVLDAKSLTLDDAIEDRLARGGVYIDVLNGVDVRVSLSGGKVFVVLFDTAPAPSI